MENLLVRFFFNCLIYEMHYNDRIHRHSVRIRGPQIITFRILPSFKISQKSRDTVSPPVQSTGKKFYECDPVETWDCINGVGPLRMATNFLLKIIVANFIISDLTVSSTKLGLFCFADCIKLSLREFSQGFR